MTPLPLLKSGGFLNSPEANSSAIFFGVGRAGSGEKEVVG